MLLPFYNDQYMKLIFSKIPPNYLTPKDAERMRIGRSVIFTSDQGLICVHLSQGDTSIDTVKSPKSSEVNLSSLKAFRSELPTGSSTSIHSPNGYWSLKSINVQYHLERLGVCLFSYPSDRPSIQLKLPPPMSLPCLDSLLGRMVYIDWPALRKARVIQVETNQIITSSKLKTGSDPNFIETGTYACQETTISRQSCNEEDWIKRGKKISEELLKKRGIHCGSVEVLVTVKPINGCLRYGLEQVQEKHGHIEVHPLQVRTLNFKILVLFYLLGGVIGNSLSFSCS